MRNKNVATALAFLMGIVGMQFFYLGRIGLGIMSCAFTFYWNWRVSVLIGVVNAVMYAVMSDEEFDRRFNRPNWKEKKAKGYYEAPATPKSARRSSCNPVAEPLIKTSDADVLKTRGMKKFKEFDYSGAIADFEQAVQSTPRDASLHFNLACCYSLLENKDQSLYYLQKAVENGFKDVEKIKTHEALAYLRIQPEFETFMRNGFKTPMPDANKAPQYDNIKKFNIT